MEKILDWRSDIEESAKRKLGQVQVKIEAQKAVLEDLIRENTKIKNDQLTTTKINDLRHQQLYKALLDEKIIHQKNQLDLTQKELETAQAQLVEAHKDKKVMEKLKEKELWSALELEKKEEQQQLDEIATLSYGRSFY
ncbi:flagellar export protein FliJ [Desemzia sp. RIT804]|nr:flagellar export protein FliJ [Desemzia sp. RIT 804]MBM6614696.1 flagellar export protein FliJ [Desemzia sp. RIT 804]